MPHEKDYLTEAAEVLCARHDSFGDIHVLTLRSGLEAVDPIFRDHHEAAGRAAEATRLSAVLDTFKGHASAARREASELDQGDGREAEIMEARAATYEAIIDALEQERLKVSDEGSDIPRWALFSRACSIRDHEGCDGKASPPVADHDCVCRCHRAECEAS